jgi:hypothetical protein
MSHEHSTAPTAIGTLGAMLFSIIKPFLGGILAFPILQTILNAFIGGTVGFFTVKLWNGEAKAWYQRQGFTLAIQNIWREKKSTIAAGITACVLLYLVFTQKATFGEVSILLVPVAYFLLYGKKPDNYPTDKLL